jgi:glutathione S-transferase
LTRKIPASYLILLAKKGGTMTIDKTAWILWTSELSPFGLKLELLCRQAQLPFSCYPQEASFWQGHKARRRVEALQKKQLAMTWPPLSELDELPLVPYLLGPKGENLVDSSAIAYWLQQQNPELNIIPPQDSAARFAMALIDEAMDEFGLYMVHHNRWAVSADDNNAGQRLGNEMSAILGPFKRFIAKQFPKRQTRRLPYLFSVAENNRYPHQHQLPQAKGFPPTQQLLDEAFEQLLKAVEAVYQHQAYLFGENMTLADASVLGQLSMNRYDQSAWNLIEQKAPLTASTIKQHYRCEPPARVESAKLELNEAIKPLLAWCCRYFVPLMQQNYCAYQQHKNQGETLFNERGFNDRRGIFEGALQGHPFRSVAKTFQVKAWKTLHQQWQQLPTEEKSTLESLLPPNHDLEKLSSPVALI